MSDITTKPARRVTSPTDLEKWTDSDAYNQVLDFVTQLQSSAIGVPNDSEVKESKIGLALLNLLDNVDSIITKNPVEVDKDISRFGKVEFRDFYDELETTSEQLLTNVLEEGKQDQIDVKVSQKTLLVEASTYLTESFGNRTRIDYGSGHELNFISFLLCLYKTGYVIADDFACVTVKVFPKYIAVMRRLQKTYWLEPAGSHGVWGLDDYHFLPFLFGAAQLSTHPYMKPKSIHNDDLVEMYHNQYMYLECIYFINKIKTLPNSQEKLSLRWHSPMLDDISAAKSWEKISGGMIKMYKAEVLGKLPIVQHFMFGTIIPCPEGISEEHLHEDDCGHVHSKDMLNTWGDCCGIKVPSAIAASESLKLAERTKFKPVPFD